MIVSRHAAMRCNQRGISFELLQQAYNVGSLINNETIWVSRQDLATSGVSPQLKDRLGNLVVHCAGEVVKTVYRANAQQARHFAKSCR